MRGYGFFSSAQAGVLPYAIQQKRQKRSLLLKQLPLLLYQLRMLLLKLLLQGDKLA